MSDRGRALERQGDLAGAAQAYLEHGALAEAANALAGMGRYADAARVLCTAIGPLPPQTPEGRALARKASALFAAAGQHTAAAALRENADPPTGVRAAVPMEASVSGPVEAAQAARRAGRPAEAAQAYARAGMHYEAGVCLLESGDFDVAIAHFVTVPVSDPRYRYACVHVAHACARRRALGFEADQFVGPFRQSEPRAQHEVEALYWLGVLYELEGFDEEAREALARVARADPSHRDAQKRLESLSRSGGDVEFEALAGADLSFWRDGPADPEESGTPQRVSGVQDSVEPVRLTPGMVVAGRYRVEAELGRGGMGVVYRARDLELAETVALKTVEGRGEDPELVARLKQEVALTRRIGHPNVVRVYDMGVHDALRFITMELLVGQSLKALVGRLPLDQALGYIAQLADALGATHGLGIVHRDVKTANVFVTTDQLVKLMDFGLAKQPDAGAGITLSGFVAGTPGYMPPEQVTSFGSVTPAADLYALGVIIYELVTGKRPFRHSDPAQILRLQFITNAAPMRSLKPDVPEQLDALVLALLSPNPKSRPGAEDVHAVLEAVC